MRRPNFVVCFAITAIVFEGVGAVQGWAGGYWNMPGTLFQRAGHGYSGGYHAPFMLGPIRFDGWDAPNKVRLPYSPNPCGGCGYGCDCYRTIDTPSAIDGVVPTPVAPTAPAAVQRVQPPPAVPPTPVVGTTLVEAPTVAPTQPLFDAPVQE